MFNNAQEGSEDKWNNGQNTPNEKKRLLDWILKNSYSQLYIVYNKCSFNKKRHTGWKFFNGKGYSYQRNYKKTGVDMLISDTMDI